ncbi:tRNA pseudouridine(55) synthase TruB [Thermohalobacter berrensis]|uniref:tRNA pseudouridine synthase B n=1 Tax=Thermohalobacter berrensis TaxID=99594 RepID=A0A419TAJ0_9FIRM|nr:tRNA pseudouridine(55) synthase TruB [Thermohalobacter berrensis]RKD34481.1 tRNA pseudouridine(55) synthase TruB [Thermohalobacter berrensis]
MNGFINVLKPPGMTSHDVVDFIRKELKIKKVGHTGTLDPYASGVLPICIGKATKLTQYLIEKKKKYRAELVLGKETDTQDKYGKIINESDFIPTESDIISVINSFKGNIKQIPPMFSAIRHKGKRLYELARKGKKVDRPSREVTIYEISIIKIDKNKKILFDVECSKGTYIRTLCNDIGKELKTYGYMNFLLRTCVDIFKIEDSFTIDEIKKFKELEKVHELIQPIDYPLYNYKRVDAIDNSFKILSNGGKISLNKIKGVKKLKENEMLRVYCKDKFIGIGTIKRINNNKFLKIEKVLL